MYITGNAVHCQIVLQSGLEWLCLQDKNCRINHDPQRNPDRELEELILSATEDTINIL